MLGRRLWDVFAHDVHAARGRILFDAMARRTIVKGETQSMIGERWVSYCMFPLLTQRTNCPLHLLGDLVDRRPGL